MGDRREDDGAQKSPTEPAEPDGPDGPDGPAAVGWAELRSGLAGQAPLVTATAIGFVVVCLSGLLIAALVDGVSENEGVTTLDRRVLSWVLDHRTPTLTTFARTVTHLGDPWFVVLVTAAASVTLFLRHRFRLGVFMILATSGAALASTVAKQLIDRRRPPAELWLGHAWGPSFPSGHATQSIACYGALAIIAWTMVRSTWWRVVIVAAAALIALLVGISRIYLAVHWLSDVVCGWAMGSLWLAALVLAGWCTPRLRRAWVDRGDPEERTHRLSPPPPPPAG